jgi:hypothetical protein
MNFYLTIKYSLKTKKMTKAFYDKSVPTRNLVTTITGIITLILTILVATGVISTEESSELQTHALNIIQGVTLVWGAIASIILMFKAKD